MSKIIAVQASQLVIPPERQRTDLDPQYLADLADSISRIGLIHPLVVRQEAGKTTLVAGFCRSKAIEQCRILGLRVFCAGVEWAEPLLPAIDLKDLDPVDAFEIELEENIRRKDLSWQDQAKATSQLLELRSAQAQRKSEPLPTVAELAKELRGTSGDAHDKTRKELIVAQYLNNPEVAKAQNVNDAFKILKRQEELKRSEDLARQLGPTFTSAVHSLHQGDCRYVAIPSEHFDVILTDPPYGISADQFSDADGKAQGSHFYDDSPEKFWELMNVFAPASFKLTKPQAHLYLFCDIEWFKDLRATFMLAGWRVFRTPLVWHNPTSQRAPWPQSGPQRKYQLVLYAVKGDKPALKLAPDIVTYPSDENVNHQAQKPVALYSDLLQRSARPGDTVIDPFCGSGTIFLAAHPLKVKATGIELDPAAYGIAAERLRGLK